MGKLRGRRDGDELEVTLSGRRQRSRHRHRHAVGGDVADAEEGSPGGAAEGLALPFAAVSPPGDPGSAKGLCALVIGRWLSHPCSAPAAKRCGRCERPTCARHLSQTAAGQCLECAGEHRPPVVPVHVGADEIASFTPDEIRAFDALPAGSEGGPTTAVVPHGS